MKRMGVWTYGRLGDDCSPTRPNAHAFFHVSRLTHHVSRRTTTCPLVEEPVWRAGSILAGRCPLEATSSVAASVARVRARVCRECTSVAFLRSAAASAALHIFSQRAAGRPAQGFEAVCILAADEAPAMTHRPLAASDNHHPWGQSLCSASLVSAHNTAPGEQAQPVQVFSVGRIQEERVSAQATRSEE